jgi:hypothetical protein
MLRCSRLGAEKTARNQRPEDLEDGSGDPSYVGMRVGSHRRADRLIRPSSDPVLSHRLRHWWGEARSRGPGRLAMHEMVTAAVTGNSQPKRLKFLVDAEPHCRVFNGCFRIDLPPLAVLAESPIIAWHDMLPVFRAGGQEARPTGEGGGHRGPPHWRRRRAQRPAPLEKPADTEARLTRRNHRHLSGASLPARRADRPIRLMRIGPQSFRPAAVPG